MTAPLFIATVFTVSKFIIFVEQENLFEAFQYAVVSALMVYSLF